MTNDELDHIKGIYSILTAAYIKSPTRVELEVGVILAMNELRHLVGDDFAYGETKRLVQVLKTNGDHDGV